MLQAVVDSDASAIAFQRRRGFADGLFQVGDAAQEVSEIMQRFGRLAGDLKLSLANFQGATVSVDRVGLIAGGEFRVAELDQQIPEALQSISIFSVDFQKPFADFDDPLQTCEIFVGILSRELRVAKSVEAELQRMQ